MVTNEALARTLRLSQRQHHRSNNLAHSADQENSAESDRGSGKKMLDSRGPERSQQGSPPVSAQEVANADKDRSES